MSKTLRRRAKRARGSGTSQRWFYSELEKFNLILLTSKGFDTYAHRQERGFKKSKEKLDWIWEAHNCDSHSLAEMALGNEIKPFRGIYCVEFIRWHRRALHEQKPDVGGYRRHYGSTNSMGLIRGSHVLYNDKLRYVGGTYNGRISLHDAEGGKRINTKAIASKAKVLHITKRRSRFLSPRPSSNLT
jgi:hypothetical protein